MANEIIQVTSENGEGVFTVAPFVQASGKPAVAIVIKKNAPGVIDALLDGQPAIAALIDENQGSNGPWVIGDLLVQNWEKAKELAGKK